VRDARRGLGEDVAIRAKLLALDLRFDALVGVEDLFAPQLDAVLTRGVEERVGDAALPVDERAVAIKGDDVEADNRRPSA
jgi:hypothetical protein